MADSVRLGILNDVITRLTGPSRPGAVPAPALDWGLQAPLPSCLVYPIDDAATRGGEGLPRSDRPPLEALASVSPVSLHALWFRLEFRFAGAVASLEQSVDAAYQWAVKQLEGQVLTGAAGQVVEAGTQFKPANADQAYLGLFVDFGVLYAHAVGDATVTE